MPKKAAAEAAVESPTAAAAEGASPGRSSPSWAMLIKRVDEVDRWSCQKSWPRAMISLLFPSRFQAKIKFPINYQYYQSRDRAK